MVSFDVNLLVHARRREAQHHVQAERLLRRYAEGDAPWALCWSVLYSFLRLVTNPRVFRAPTPLEHALDDLESLLDSPLLHLMGEGVVHRAHMANMVRAANPGGNLIADAHLAALCLEHGVSELLTLDRDLRRFPGLRCRNPFVG